MISRRALLATALAAAAAPVRGAEGGTFRIGYQKNGILVVAKQQGAIEAALKPLGVSVRWTEFSFGPPLLEALGLGAVDFGQTGDAPPVFAQAAGADLVYAAAQEAAGSGAAILLPKGSAIRTIADLRGKRVAFAKASSAHNFTIAALETVGLTYADIVPVTLAPADAAAAFARGSVDAWTIWDPYFAIAERGDGVRILTLATDVAKPSNYFLANRRVAQADAPVLQAAIAALSGVAAWCEAHRPEVAALLSKGTGVPLEATRRAVDRTDYRIAPMSEGAIADQQRVADRFHTLGLIANPIRIRDAVWSPPAPPAASKG
ncbi:aliphatic sulfonate ABC transporter substrate-binding protein [Methylobacterium sp. BTF04]|uniref:aliphatic sulfonate ABC transporter substrate-binding protein n=1 Tax=Methylobacterium sp. BTF04 TaxID=2708300 RepID=UPI0013D89AB1|nr:aliphatic sulfonate ABC transporter substrate-binding protein [Methylobacterium sp. BTF04]NEU14358.1 aliphatic sulfonate ABC transporter substrate-binding protein [Methylobacterium sp. BTF04]